MEVAVSEAELLDKIRTTLDLLNGPDALRISPWCWSDYWEEIKVSAYYIGLPQVIDDLDRSFPNVMLSPDSPAAHAIRRQLREMLVEVHRRLGGASADPNRLSDTKSDTANSSKRRITEHECKVAAIYRDAAKRGMKVNLDTVISDYLRENPEVRRKASTIKRTLEANREMYRSN